MQNSLIRQGSPHSQDGLPVRPTLRGIQIPHTCLSLYKFDSLLSSWHANFGPSDLIWRLKFRQFCVFFLKFFKGKFRQVWTLWKVYFMVRWQSLYCTEICPWGQCILLMAQWDRHVLSRRAIWIFPLLPQLKLYHIWHSAYKGLKKQYALVRPFIKDPTHPPLTFLLFFNFLFSDDRLWFSPFEYPFRESTFWKMRNDHNNRLILSCGAYLTYFYVPVNGWIKTCFF